MQRLQKHFYEFGPFRIDTEERQLLRDGAAVSLTAKVFDLLLVLVENKGHTLGKDELMERVWGGTFVEENNLSRNISMLRKVLGDDLHEPRFVRTMPKRGYRFEPDVHEVLEDVDALVVERRTHTSITFREEIRLDTETRRRGDAARFSVIDLISRYRVVAASIVATLLIAGSMAWITGLTQKNEVLSLTFAENEKLRAVRGTANTEAFELYKRGRVLWQNRSAAGLHEATILLEQAVEKDPDFALAHAALADAYAFDTGNWKKAEETANRSIGLDPALGEPHASIGFVKFFWEWNSAEAELHFKRSLSLNSEYATAHQWFAIILAADGRFNQAFAEMSRAMELEPESISVNADMCQMLYFLRRYDDAERQCKRTLEIDGKSFNAHSYLYSVYTAQGKYNEAVEAFITRERLSANNASIPSDFEELRTAFDQGGIEAFWREQIRQRERFTTGCGYTVAWYHG